MSQSINLALFPVPTSPTSPSLVLSPSTQSHSQPPICDIPLFPVPLASLTLFPVSGATEQEGRELHSSTWETSALACHARISITHMWKTYKESENKAIGFRMKILAWNWGCLDTEMSANCKTTNWTDILSSSVSLSNLLLVSWRPYTWKATSNQILYWLQYSSCSKPGSVTTCDCRQVTISTTGGLVLFPPGDRRQVMFQPLEGLSIRFAAGVTLGRQNGLNTKCSTIREILSQERS